MCVSMKKNQIDRLAARSVWKVYFITFLVALLGSALFSFGFSNLMFAVWVPLCFLVLPTIHYLSREVRELKSRLDRCDKGADGDGC